MYGRACLVPAIWFGERQLMGRGKLGSAFIFVVLPSFVIRLLILSCASVLAAATPPIAPPAPGKLYHGFYWGGVGTDDHDPTEHDVTPADVSKYEQAIGAKTAWVYFSNN